MSEQLSFLVDHLPDLLIGFPSRRPGGLLMSILLAVGSLAAGLVVAVIVGLAHHSHLVLIRVSARAFVWVFRGIPLIVLLILVHQYLSTTRLGVFGPSTLVSAFVALALYSSAYQADIIQTGVGAIPQQLVEDARLLGARRWQLTRTVTLPYSLRVMRPALTGQAITLFKDTSVVVVLGVADLTTTARIALGGDVTNAPYWVTTYLFVGIMYFVCSFGFSRGMERLEHRRTLRRSVPLFPDG